MLSNLHILLGAEHVSVSLLKLYNSEWAKLVQILVFRERSQILLGISICSWGRSNKWAWLCGCLHTVPDFAGLGLYSLNMAVTIFQLLLGGNLPRAFLATFLHNLQTLFLVQALLWHGPEQRWGVQSYFFLLQSVWLSIYPCPVYWRNRLINWQEWWNMKLTLSLENDQF